ncbi:restriction endonuclease subunit S [Flavobacterium sp. WC2430]|uniref:restriction endonuclease subunit S n=1 Tax=Flavobacterium sp. WC2430 TaxID=3234137 RepID=UPI0034657128
MENIKPYSKYKPSGISWLGDVPEHWSIKRIKYVFKEQDKRSEIGSEDLLSVSHYTGVTRKSDKVVNGDFMTNAKTLVGYKIVEKGDLVINIMLAWNGSLGISKYDGITSPAYCVYKSLIGGEKYFGYLFRTKNAQQEFKKQSTGIIDSRLRLYTDKFFNIKTVIPSLEEQTAIANFLDYKTAKIDRFIRKKKQLIKLLNEQKAGIINHAVTKGLDPNATMKPSAIEWLGDIPEHWEVRKLKYSVRLNQHNAFDKQESEHTKIALENIEGKTGRILELNKNSFEGIGTIFKKGDILFGKLRPYLAKVVAPNFEGSCVNELLVLTPNTKIWNSEFLKFRMLSSGFIKMVDNSTFGAKMPRASWNFIGGLKISCPPLDVQKEIVLSIEEETFQLNQLIQTIEKEIVLTQEYRTALIAEAVTGKIDVRAFVIPTVSEQEELYEEIEEELDMVAEDAESYENE